MFKGNMATVSMAAALALLAGTVHAQQEERLPAEPTAVQYRDTGEWQTADFINELSESIVVLQKDMDEQVRVEIIRGQVQAKLNDESISTEKVQQKGEQLRVVDDEGETVAEFTLPDLKVLHQARLTGPEPLLDQRRLGIPQPDFHDRQLRDERFHDDRRFRERQVRTPMVDVRTSAVGIVMLEAMPHHLEGTDHRMGIVVDAVQEGMPAHDAGLQRGDIIVAVEGREGVTPDRLRGLLRRVRTGEMLTFTVIRDGEEGEYEITTMRLAPPHVNWDYMVTGFDERELRQHQMMLERQRQMRGFREGRILGFGITEAEEDELAEADEYDAGLKVTHVARGTVLDDAGLRRGDVILEVDGESELTQERFKELFKEKQPGDPVELTVLRDGTTHTMQFRIDPAWR